MRSAIPSSALLPAGCVVVGVVVVAGLLPPHAARLIDQAPACDKIIADGKRMFAALALRYSQFLSVDRAEEHHAAVAAASVIAKVIRDHRFNQIRARYEPEVGPIGGGGYANAHTRKGLRAYAERHGRLPEEARRTWPYPHLVDLIGDVRPPGPQVDLFESPFD